MCALGNLHEGRFEWDTVEPPFSESELSAAAALRARGGDLRLKRKDQCPHTPPCGSVRECLEAIAWYLRYRPDIEQQLTDAELQPL